MTCDSGQRKVFADEVVETLTALVKKHGLSDVVVNRNTNPVMVAARGCLQDDKGNDSREHVELVLQISNNLAKADQISLVNAEIATDNQSEVYRAFDLSEIVANDSVVKAAEIPDKDC